MTADEIVEVVQLSVPAIELFSHTISPSETSWADEVRLAQATIQYAAFLYANNQDSTYDDYQKDLVASVLLRRALLSAHAVLRLLTSGLIEPSLVQCRSLLDIELSMTLIARDTSGVKAFEFVAHSFVKKRRHGEEQLRNALTRTGLLERLGEVERTKEQTRYFASVLRRPEFASVANTVGSRKSWHGYENVSQAFDAAGLGDVYRTIYDTFGGFVHANNPDYDVLGPGESPGAVRLRSLVQYDDRVLRSHLLHLSVSTNRITRLFVALRGEARVQEAPHSSSVRRPDSTTLSLTNSQALTKWIADLTEAFLADHADQPTQTESGVGDSA